MTEPSLHLIDLIVYLLCLSDWKIFVQVWLTSGFKSCVIIGYPIESKYDTSPPPKKKIVYGNNSVQSEWSFVS